MDTHYGSEIMILPQKEQIRRLRLLGNSYSEISSVTGLPVGSIKAFCSRNKLNKISIKGTCEQCGKPLEQQKNQKPRRFCSDTCRYSWWSKNRDKCKSKGTIHICADCGAEYHSYDVNSKYCSHACYIKDRFGKARDCHDTRTNEA